VIGIGVILVGTITVEVIGVGVTSVEVITIGVINTRSPLASEDYLRASGSPSRLKGELFLPQS